MIGLRTSSAILLLGVVGIPCASAIVDPGTGLLGNYFNDRFLSVQGLAREDPVVDFDWGGDSPDPLIAPDNFSVRWSGKIRPEFSETYTFYVTADDGVRLWINGQTVVDAWLDQAPTQWTGSISLIGDQLVDIQVEYYENGGGALVRVEWESASQPRQVVPQDRLYPPPVGNLNPQVDLLAPLPGDVFIDPLSILLAANASDLDGDIARVDFFANGTKIGQATTSPFEFAWSEMDPIQYILYARAVDKDGGVSVSGEVSITVILTALVGLPAEYFNNMDLTPPAALQRLDPRIDFDWGGDSPDPAIFFDGFSVRWSGLITPRYSETYTFAVLVDDGARLWIDGVPVIDTWIDQPPTRHEGFITLTANQAYDIEMEFYENGGGAVARLYWSSLSQPLEIVPALRLQPPGPGNRRPRAPRITEPLVDGQLVNFADVHMETAPFSDPNPGDIHVCSDFEIWTAGLGERAWVTACIGGLEKVHTHLGDGIFENSHAGRSELFPDQDYVLRVRHRDSSGDPATEWSPWAERFFHTTSAVDPIPGQPGWIVQPGFKVELVASGFQLPVNIAFLPNPGPQPSDPLFYVAELYGQIKVVSRDGTITDYATGLLNFDPTGAFPGSGEQGLAGLVIEPNSGDLFVSLLYSEIPGVEAAAHYPKIFRFHSIDGGRTAATQTDVLDMAGETQGQSHQISNLSLGPDGKLYVHVGDGFDASTAQDLSRFRGKILRLNLDGSAPADNPFYNAADGIDAADYVFALGFRNPFGGAWRASDGQHYSVENGPSIDRFAQILPGRNYLWDGSDESMFNYAIYNWIPAKAPVNLAFVEPGRFGGSGFPPAKFGHAYVSESGPTWASGPQFNGKRISEFILDSAGYILAGPIPLVEYNGPGKATVVALAPGPDGLYFSDFYKDRDYTSPIDRGANILRVRPLDSLPPHKWAFPTGSALDTSSPAIGADGTVYVSSPDEKVYAINPNGTQKWAFPTVSFVNSSPAIGVDGTIYVGSVDLSGFFGYSGIYAIDPNGTEKWNLPIGQEVTSTPAIGADGTIYVGSDDGNLYAINPNGTQQWAFPTGTAVFSSPAIGEDGTIYVGSGSLYAIDPNGTLKWAFPTGSFGASSPAIDGDGTIYVGSDDHNVYAINPNGTLKWAFPTGALVRSSPAIGADGTLYVGSSDHNVNAITTSSVGLANSPWPMFHHDVRHTGFVAGGPVNVNNRLHLRADELVTTYDPTPVPNGPAGTFIIEATFDNTSDKTIFNPFFEVIQLSGGNLLLNADGAPGGVGATMTPPESPTTPLLPGATGKFQFRIGLQTQERFDFSVNMLGEIQ